MVSWWGFGALHNNGGGTIVDATWVGGNIESRPALQIFINRARSYALERYTDRHQEVVTGLHMRIILAYAPCLVGTACAAAAADADAPHACLLACFQGCLLAFRCLLRGVAGTREKGDRAQTVPGRFDHMYWDDESPFISRTREDEHRIADGHGAAKEDLPAHTIILYNATWAVGAVFGDSSAMVRSPSSFVLLPRVSCF
ncbi:hypothetical protein F5Y05DRAFT_315833 [Hypoxylon sp. FL0543]|nr:hypothetical protein F5Y05DRAFT_315833 [Hypoxylon sp. FL0543]